MAEIRARVARALLRIDGQEKAMLHAERASDVDWRR